jgi:hypothetical protein
MSWDLFVQDWGEVKTLSEIRDDFEPQSIGTRSKLSFKIQEVLPAVDFSDPAWGIFEAQDHSIEFNMGDEEECMSFSMHVHGGNSALNTVHLILSALNLRASDGSSDKLIE